MIKRLIDSEKNCIDLLGFCNIGFIGVPGSNKPAIS